MELTEIYNDFSNRNEVDILNFSFDDEYAKRNPYRKEKNTMITCMLNIKFT